MIRRRSRRSSSSEGFARSPEGRLYQYRARKKRRFSFSFAGDLRGKGSMRPAEKLAFQLALVAAMNARARRTYRADVAADLAFVTQLNREPPQLHTLAKNYLDLLQAPLSESVSPEKKLLLKDDKKIKVLSVACRFEGTPSLDFNFRTARDFAVDVELWADIRRGELGDDDRDIERLFGLTPEDDRREDAIEQYRHACVAPRRWPGLAPEAHELMLANARGEMQRVFLGRNDQFIVETLSMMLPTKGYLKGIAAIVTRGVLLTDAITLALPNAPAAAGETETFKTSVRGALERLVERSPWLVPMTNLLSMTLFVVPHAQGIDLDNLARLITPIVHDVLKPPPTLARSFARVPLPKSAHDSHWESQLALEKRVPQQSLTRYEVIELPRCDADPEHGFVRLAFGDGSSLETMTSRIDRDLARWSEVFERADY